MLRRQLAIVLTFNADVTPKERAVKLAEIIASDYIFTKFEFQKEIIEVPYVDDKYGDYWIDGEGKH